MKKLTAIFLIALLAFYWYGYRVVILHFEDVAERTIESRIDGSAYTDDQLVEIRVPINLLYQTASTSFERTYGEIEIEGTIHNYVKQKIENGTLVLLCIPNTDKQVLKEAGNNLFVQNNGLAGEHPSKESSPLTKAFKTAYCDCENNSQDAALQEFINLNQRSLSNTPSYNSRKLSVCEQPPDALS